MIIDKIFYNASQEQTNYIHYEDDIYGKMTPRILKKILSEFSTFKTIGGRGNSPIVRDFVIDVCDSIERCRLTDIQKSRLNRWLDGYTEQDIADMDNCSRWVVSKTIMSACEKILKKMRKC